MLQILNQYLHRVIQDSSNVYWDSVSVLLVVAVLIIVSWWWWSLVSPIRARRRYFIVVWRQRRWRLSWVAPGLIPPILSFPVPTYRHLKYFIRQHQTFDQLIPMSFVICLVDSIFERPKVSNINLVYSSKKLSQIVDNKDQRSACFIFPLATAPGY